MTFTPATNLQKTYAAKLLGRPEKEFDNHGKQYLDTLIARAELANRKGSR